MSSLISVFVFLICFFTSAVFILAPLFTARFLFWKTLRPRRILLFTGVSSLLAASVLTFAITRNARGETAANLEEIRRLGCVHIEGTSLELLNAQYKRPFEPGIYRVLFNDATIDRGNGAKRMVHLVKEGPHPSESIRPVDEDVAVQLPATPCLSGPR